MHNLTASCRLGPSEVGAETVRSCPLAEWCCYTEECLTSHLRLHGNALLKSVRADIAVALLSGVKVFWVMVMGWGCMVGVVVVA